MIKKFGIFILFIFLISSCKQQGKILNVIYMAQAGYQPEEVQKMADDFQKKTSFKEPPKADT